MGGSGTARPEDVEAIRGAQEPGSRPRVTSLAVLPTERAWQRVDSRHAVRCSRPRVAWFCSRSPLEPPRSIPASEPVLFCPEVLEGHLP